MPRACLLVPLALALLPRAAAAAPPPTPLTVEAMAGPVPTLAEACPGCTVREHVRARAPFREVVLADLVHPARQGPGPIDRYLVVRTRAGFYALALGREQRVCGGDHEIFQSFAVTRATARDVLPGHGAELVFDLASGTIGERPDGEVDQIDDEGLRVCGVDDQGPYCAAQVIAARRASTARGSWSARVRFAGDGTLEWLDDAGTVAQRATIQRR